MRRIHAPKTRTQLRYRRHLRVRSKVAGTAERPRLVVFRSLKHIYAQLVDDDRGVTLLGVGDGSEGIAADGAGKVARGKAVGKLLAEKAKAAGFSRVVFDRAGVTNLHCDIHPDEIGFVVVVPNRAYARPDSLGRFSLPSLPAGSYRLRAWHPHLGEVRANTEIPRGGNASVTLTF